MSRYIITTTFEDPVETAYFRQGGTWTFDEKNAFVFTDRGAAEVVASQGSGREIEELPEPESQRPPTEIELALGRLNGGTIRDRMAALAANWENNLNFARHAYDIAAQGGSEQSQVIARERVETVRGMLLDLRKALR